MSGPVEFKMSDNRLTPYAALLLRLTLGLMMFAHGAIKVLVFTPAGTVRYFGSLGFPEAFAYFIIALELLGGIALILGVLTRWVALLFAAELIGTIVVVHSSKGFLFTNAGGGWEFPAFAAATAVALALLGDGPYALTRPSRAAG